MSLMNMTTIAIRIHNLPMFLNKFKKCFISDHVHFKAHQCNTEQYLQMRQNQNCDQINRRRTYLLDTKFDIHKM